MAREKIASKVISEALDGVTVKFMDDSVLDVKLADLSEEMIVHLALHGLSQKLGDAYSGEKDLVVAFGKAKAVAKRLIENNWKAVREGGGGGRITDLAKALAAVTGRDLAEVVERIELMDKDEKKNLRAHAQIKVKLAEITAARAAEAAAKAEPEAEVDLGAMF